MFSSWNEVIVRLEIAKSSVTWTNYYTGHSIRVGKAERACISPTGLHDRLDDAIISGNLKDYSQRISGILTGSEDKNVET